MLICRFDRWAESRCGCCRRRLTNCCRWTHPARFVAEFVDALDREDWGELGVEIDGGGAGSASLPSTCAVERVAVRFHDRVRSCRKLELAAGTRYRTCG